MYMNLSYTVALYLNRLWSCRFIIMTKGQKGIECYNPDKRLYIYTNVRIFVCTNVATIFTKLLLNRGNLTTSGDVVFSYCILCLLSLV
jgi:hypothetical protein